MLRIVTAASLKEGPGNSRNNELAHSGGQEPRATRWRGRCCDSRSAGVLMYRIGLGRSGEQLAWQQEPRDSRAESVNRRRKTGHRLGFELDAQLPGVLAIGGRRTAGAPPVAPPGRRNNWRIAFAGARGRLGCGRARKSSRASTL